MGDRDLPRWRAAIAVLAGQIMVLASFIGPASAVMGPNLAAGTDSPRGSNPGTLTAVGDTLFFSANGPGGRELWKSDGTDEGTVRVKNINPGRHGSSPHYLTNVDGTLYFRAFDGVNWGIWISDGTAPGTRIVDYIDGDEFTSFKGMLFFRGSGGLWRSDGTAVGTVLVREVASGCCFRAITEIEVVDQRLYFAAVSFEGGPATDQLWTSDGTSGGSALIRQINHLENSRGILSLMRVGNRLFFLRDTKAELSDVFSAYWSDLWTSDGTGSGTKRVKDILPGEADGVVNLTASNQMAFFLIDQTLWTSNGTGTGTVMLHDFAPDYPSSDHPMTNVAGRVYFVAGDSLWRSNGTSPGTKVVAAVAPYQQPFCVPDPHGPGGCPLLKDFDPTALGALLIFPSEEGNDGVELWKSNGTAAGTRQLKDIRPGTKGSKPMNLTRVGELVFFIADDGTHGRELYRTDGTSAGTWRVNL
jgi:ELWxxDGT repeat protein